MCDVGFEKYSVVVLRKNLFKKNVNRCSLREKESFQEERQSLQLEVTAFVLTLPVLLMY